MKGVVDGASLEERRAALASAVRLYPVAARFARRTLFIRHLDLNVRSATPLLRVAEEALGRDLSSLVWLAEPPLGWPARLFPRGARDPLRADRTFGFDASHMARRHRRAGVLHRPCAYSRDVVGLRVACDAVELTAMVGDLKVETWGGFARVELDVAVPHVLASASVGLPIGVLVRHRWFAGAAWPIVEVGHRDADRASVIFETGGAAWRLPWPEVG